MAYVTTQARQDLLDIVAEAIDHIGVALGVLGDVYEQIDERSADRLEDELFRPVQQAFGRARRTHTEFAERHGLATRTFDATGSAGASERPGDAIDRVAEAVADADVVLAELQDSMMPVEVGDEALRAGLAEVRRLLAAVTDAAARFQRVLGR